MIRRALAAVVACALLTGCSSTVAGTAVEDPAAVPKPETGSFATTARTLAPTTQGGGERLEGHRMAETVPYLYEIDPQIHRRGDVSSGSREDLPSTVRQVFGDPVADAVGTKPEVWTSVGARSRPLGATSDSKSPDRSEYVMLLRMSGPAEASALVGPALRALDKRPSRAGMSKVETRIPGYDGAVAYLQAIAPLPAATVAFLAYKQYVIGVYGDFSADQVRTLFARQTKALDGFQPTPADKLWTLPRDADSVARLTLAPPSGDTGFSLPARVAVLRQTDVARSVKTFADAGVDVVGTGDSTVYRAKDAQAAAHVAAEFLDENRTMFASVEEEKVTGAPGATCLTMAIYPGSSTKTTWCVVAVGRYVAEYSSPQRKRSTQAIGAAYLVLKGNS